MNEQLSKLEVGPNKLPLEVQKHKNNWLNETTRKNQDMKIKLNKEIKMLRKTQAAINLEWKFS